MELFLLFLQFVLLFGNGIQAKSDCPKGWISLTNFCYLLVKPTAQDPPKTWEDARINCLGYGADLASINSSLESNFIRMATRDMGRNAFWIGLSKNGSITTDRRSGWVWSDGSKFDYTRWHWGEPSNYRNNEKCVEVYANTGRWNDNNCNDKMLSICKRKKGLPYPTRPVIDTPKPEKAKIICDFGWAPFRNSCYKFERSYRSWQDARLVCTREGGDLVKIDSAEEQHFLAYSVRSSYANYWTGLNNLTTNKGQKWVWVSDKSQPNYTNWLNDEPSNPRSERCVEMLGGYQSGFWNDQYCSNRKFFICEKQEEKNECPSDWLEFNNVCYQFNLGPNQKQSWKNAKQSCESVGHFSSLVSITSKEQQEFINKQVSFSTTLLVWIGLNDIAIEDIFKWTDGSPVGNFSNWEGNNNVKLNTKWKDCVVMVQPDGRWAVDVCITSRPFICQRRKELFTCKTPLGMENGKITNEQITAKSYMNFSTTPDKARFNSNGSWCPKSNDANEYLQVDLGNLYKIKRIAVQSSTKEFCIKHGSDGKGYKFYGDKEECEIIRTVATGENSDYFQNLKFFTARYIRIYQKNAQDACLRIEFFGCLSASTVVKNVRISNWIKMPNPSTGSTTTTTSGNSPSIYVQVNQMYVKWTAARSFCLQQGADLLSLSTGYQAGFSIRLSRQLRSYSYWIGLNDRDYTSNYYWSDGSPVGYFKWGSAYPRDSNDIYSCVQLRKYQRDWRDAQCYERRPFICMKTVIVAQSTKSIVDSSVTGAWMGTSTYYWPLSIVENKKVFGTKTASAYGAIKSVNGAQKKPNSALQFSGAGSYLQVVFNDECLTYPDQCLDTGLTLFFMASFDNDVANWKEKIYIFDSVGNDIQKSTGVAVYIKNQQLYFAVSTMSSYILLNIPLQADTTWRQYAMVWNNNIMTVYKNGKTAQSGNVARKKSKNSNDLKKDLHIGIQPGSKVDSEKIRLCHFAFWEQVLPAKDLLTILKTEFGLCPYGWIGFGKSCYQFNGITRNWNTAQKVCQSSGGYLATISSPVEQSFITLHTNISSWIGLLENTPSVFAWVNYEPMRYTNWRSRSTFAYRTSQACAVARGNGYGTWAEYPCTMRASFICEKNKDENLMAQNTPAISRPKFMRVCQFSRSILFCPSNTYIRITSAFWGRKRSDVCRKISITNCGLSSVGSTTKKLKDQCDGSTVCALYANSHFNFLGNPCRGVYKYLEVNYTCNKEAVQHRCPPGWKRSLDGNACYGLILSKKSWFDAQQSCQKTFNANLISIAGRFEQAMATSLMEKAWDTDVWIGLNDNETEGVYKWSDSSLVTWSNWYVGNPHGHDTSKNCVFMNLTRTRKDWMYWRIGDCKRKAAFMCEKMIGKRKTLKPSVPAEATCLRDWRPFGNFCYKISSVQMNWQLARQYCVRNGGNLASIVNQEENEFIRNHTAHNSLWIGLETKGVFRGQVWSDRKPVSFTNWEFGQPDSYDNNEECTRLHKDTGYWRDTLCGYRSSFVCKKLKSTSAFSTKPPPTYKQSPVCNTGWVLYNANCYWFSNDSFSELKTWHDAEMWCKSNLGHLVTVESDEKRNFLVQIISKKRTFSYWIGLHDLNGESNYKWSDGNDYGKYVYWNNGEPNNYHGQEDCVSMVKTTGKWNDNHCSMKKPFICEALNKTAPIPLIEILKPLKPTGDRYCPPGWVINGKWCYQFNTDPTDYKSWVDAKTTCEQGKNSSVGELVSIANEFEQAFILLNIKGADKALWIGMNNFHSFRSFIWTDNSPVKFYHWANKHPIPAYGSRCVEISPFSKEAGKWKTVQCTVLNGYICKTESSGSPTERKSVLRPTMKAQFNCSQGGYTAYDQACYKLVKTLKSFEEAKKYCEKEKATLINIDSQFHQAFLVYLMEKDFGNVWVGLSRDSWSTFQSTDGGETFYTNWGPGQPNRHLNQSSCVQANVTGRDLGVWDDVNCGNKNYFVCQINNGEPKVTASVEGLCQDGWRKQGKYCYKYFETTKSWPEARHECRNNRGELVSVLDDQELDFVLFNFFNVHKIWYWTGLNDRNEEKAYRWSDKSPVTFVNWKQGQPNDPSQVENCVLIDSRDGQWYDWHCNARYPFICKRSLECSKMISLKPSYISKGKSLAGFGPEHAIITDPGPSDVAWCTSGNTVGSKLQVNLPSKYRITSITIQGRNGTSSEFVRSFMLDYDGNDWETIRYKIDGENKLFFANNDGIFTLTNTLDPPIEASRIAVIPTAWHGNRLCLRISLHGCKFVCQDQLGMSSGTIRNSAIVASSQRNGYESYLARPIFMGWCAQSNDVAQWIQVQFEKVTLLTKITTFGNKKDSYVKMYKLLFSGDGNNWIYYKQNGIARIFKGNVHATYAMSHSLTNSYQASYLQIIPLSWNKNICMRFELFGCSKDCNGPLIERNNKATDVKLSSSDTKSNPGYARLQSGKAWCTKIGQYLQIDFETTMRLTKISTQGTPLNYGQPRRVLEYNLGIYKNGKWETVNVKNPVKLKPNDTTTLTTYDIPQSKNGFVVSKLRIIPKTFTNGVCMRVEVYGCLAGNIGKPIKPSPPVIKNNPTSFIATVRYTSLKWNDALSNPSSTEFKNMAEKISNGIKDVYKNNKNSHGKNALKKVIVQKLRKGSVISETYLEFDDEFAKNNNITMSLRRAVRSGNIGSMIVDKDSLKIIVLKSSTQGVKSGSSKIISPGAVAGLVIGILLIIIIALGIGVYCKRKRNNFYGPKQFNNPILYSTTNTEGDEFEMH